MSFMAFSPVNNVIEFHCIYEIGIAIHKYKPKMLFIY